MRSDAARNWPAFRHVFYQALLSAWPAAAKLGFAMLIPIVVLGRVELGPLSFGYRSFSRNVAIFVVLGAVLGARDLRLARSPLTAPLLAFLAAIWLSVWANGGIMGDVRNFAAVVALFFAARAIASSESGKRWLFHWLGAVSIAVLVTEVAANPLVLTLRESYRTELVSMHANTIGECFAILSPIFLADALSRRGAVAGWIYAAIGLVDLLISFSRAAWIAAIVGTVAVVLVKRAERTATRLRSPLIGAIVVGGVAIAYLSLGRTEADLQRLRIFQASLSLFREHWLFGVGFGIGNLQQLFPARYIELFGEGLFLFHSHNTYIDLLAGTGLIGTPIGLWLLFALARRAVQGTRTALSAAERLRAIGHVVAVGLLLLLGMTDTIFYNSHLMIVLAVAWALMDADAARTPG